MTIEDLLYKTADDIELGLSAIGLRVRYTLHLPYKYLYIKESFRYNLIGGLDTGKDYCA